LPLPTVLNADDGIVVAPASVIFMDPYEATFSGTNTEMPEDDVAGPKVVVESTLTLTLTLTSTLTGAVAAVAVLDLINGKLAIQEDKRPVVSVVPLVSSWSPFVEFEK
jgi:hypothetical protein